MDFPYTVTVPGIPGITVKIYRQTQQKGGKAYVRYVVAYSLKGEKKLKPHPEFADAQAFAEEMIKAISNGEQAALELRNGDAFAWLRAKEHAEKVGLPVDTICERYAEILAVTGQPLEACRDWARRNGSVRLKATIPDAAAAMIKQEESQAKDGRRKKAWVKLLRSHIVNAFAADFTDHVDRVESKQINAWLIGADLAERTKKNRRDCLAFFFQWCRLQGYLPRDADPMGLVADFRKRRRGAVSIMTPEDLKLLLPASGDMAPYFALRAFAGLRDSEARLIDWRNVDLDGGWVEVTAEVAKDVDADDGARRLIPLRPVLRSWLKDHAKASGRVCPCKNTANKLREICAAAGVTWRRNVLRHSFISYDVAESNDIPAVALRSGNSPAIIRKHYLRVVKPEAAAAWFSVLPQGSGDIVSEPDAAQEENARVICYAEGI